MKLLEDKIYDYIIDNSTPLDELLGELERVTYLQTTQPRMMSGYVQGAILRGLTRIINPKRVLEIGTFTGYSALSIASALSKDAVLHTIDINDETLYIANEFFDKSSYSDIIKSHVGSALDVIPQIGGAFDMVFIDGNKREYIDYYNLLMDGDYLCKGAVILADNVLWDGKVINPEASDSQTRTIVEFNSVVACDSRVEATILPLRDGLSMITIL